MFHLYEIKTRREIDDLFEKNKTEFTPSKDKLGDQTNERSFRDVHVYDHVCESVSFPSYSQEEKTKAVRHIQSLFVNGMAIHMINIMLSRNNYDPLNKVDSLDMLYWIYTHPITPELFYLLEEQIADNGSLGTCLMGSSHRIRQIYYAQKDLGSFSTS